MAEKVEKFILSLELGVSNVGITVVLVFIISTLLSIITCKYKEQINMKKYNYKVISNYNVNSFGIGLSLKISEKTLNIIKTIILFSRIKKRKKSHIDYKDKKILKI